MTLVPASASTTIPEASGLIVRWCTTFLISLHSHARPAGFWVWSVLRKQQLVTSCFSLRSGTAHLSKLRRVVAAHHLLTDHLLTVNYAATL